MSQSIARILIGLGNPGSEYASTRHNVGFRVLDAVAHERGSLFRSARRFEPPHEEPGRVLKGFSFAHAEFPMPDVPAAQAAGGDASARKPSSSVLLVKPETFMNRSGEPVAPLVACLGLDPQSLLVVYDDLDLPLGALRLRPHGGHGGHNGMRSLIDRLGSDRFPRLRVGIGRRSADAARHVLSLFDPNELVEIQISIKEAAEAASHWLAYGDIEECMTRFHSRWARNVQE